MIAYMQSSGKLRKAGLTVLAWTAMGKQPRGGVLSNLGVSDRSKA
jgi:hypothetical protein